MLRIIKHMISCIVLSAGLSKRFGSPKALARLGDATVLEHLQATLINSCVDEIVIVLGAHQEKIKPYILNHRKIKVVYNKDYILGQTSSFQAGLQVLASDVAGIMLMPVDCPLVAVATIDMLVGHFNNMQPQILIPCFNNKKGHPPIFHADLKGSLCALDSSVGLNVFQHRHAEQIKLCAVDDKGVVTTFNTPEEFACIRAAI